MRISFNQEAADVIENDTKLYDEWEYGQGVDYAAPPKLLKSLFNFYNVTQEWKDNNYTWGWLDEDTGLWNGACAAVS